MPLLGEHQARNAAVALAAIDMLIELGWSLNRGAVLRGLSSLTWPARVEVLGESPWLVVDGAHNVASAEALAETLRTCLPAGPRTLVFGTTRDKDLRGQLRALLPAFESLVTTRYVENPRAVSPEEIARAITDVDGRSAVVTTNPAEALETARRLTPRDGLICVTGSMFLAAEMRALILDQEEMPAASPIVT
jgi:dihydrofolate synthase/folylpolyglutamate synthase